MPITVGPDSLDIRALTQWEALRYGELVEQLGEGYSFSYNTDPYEMREPEAPAPENPEEATVSYWWKTTSGVYSLSLHIDIKFDETDKSDSRVQSGMGIEVRRSAPESRPGSKYVSPPWRRRRPRLDKGRYFDFWSDGITKNWMNNYYRNKELQKLCGKFFPLFKQAYANIYDCLTQPVGPKHHEIHRDVSAWEEAVAEDEPIMQRLEEQRVGYNPLDGRTGERPIFWFEHRVNFTIDSGDYNIGELQFFNFIITLVTAESAPGTPSLESLRSVFGMEFWWAPAAALRRKKRRKSLCYFRGKLGFLLQPSWSPRAIWDRKQASGKLQHGFLYFLLEHHPKRKWDWKYIEIPVRAEIVSFFDKCLQDFKVDFENKLKDESPELAYVIYGPGHHEIHRDISSWEEAVAETSERTFSLKNYDIDQFKDRLYADGWEISLSARDDDWLYVRQTSDDEHLALMFDKNLYFDPVTVTAHFYVDDDEFIYLTYDIDKIPFSFPAEAEKEFRNWADPSVLKDFQHLWDRFVSCIATIGHHEIHRDISSWEEALTKEWLRIGMTLTECHADRQIGLPPPQLKS